MMIHRIGNSEVKVISGDICESKCEVIVSSDDSRLSQGGGVSRAARSR
jgi:O-acetyl-ADP-ribose deacetylase (regulator of RNase III)